MQCNEKCNNCWCCRPGVEYVEGYASVQKIELKLHFSNTQHMTSSVSSKGFLVWEKLILQASYKCLERNLRY